jgi:hypothetical protein
MKRRHLITLGLAAAALLATAGLVWAALIAPGYVVISNSAEGGGAGGNRSTAPGFILEGTFGGEIQVSGSSSSFGLCSGFGCSAIPYPRIYVPLVMNSS